MHEYYFKIKDVSAPIFSIAHKKVKIFFVLDDLLDELQELCRGSITASFTDRWEAVEAPSGYSLCIFSVDSFAEKMMTEFVQKIAEDLKVTIIGYDAYDEPEPATIKVEVY
jgi:hypothetical protein